MSKLKQMDFTSKFKAWDCEKKKKNPKGLETSPGSQPLKGDFMPI